MKRYLVPLLVMVPLLLAAQTPARYESGTVTFDLPAGWKTTEYPGLQYDIAAGPVSDGFMQNIVVADEVYDGGIESYIAANKETMVQVIDECVIISDEPFQTDSGITSWKMIVENVQYNHHLRQFFYIYQYPNRYYITSCTVLAEEDGRIEQIFDTVMRTFMAAE